MSKTALKILIESIELVEGTYNNEADSALFDVKKVAQSLLPKEKEDIMNAFDSGCELGIGYENAEEYFSKTFNPSNQK